jgi:hypothetical protein
MNDTGIEIRMYTRPGCHLCDDAREVILGILRILGTGGVGLKLQVLDVEDDPRLESRFGQDIPVVEIISPRGGRIFRHRLDPDEFRQEISRLWNR